MNTDQELKNIELEKKLVVYAGEDRVVLAEDLLKEIKDENKNSRFYNTGFEFFDGIVGGFKRGQVVIISAATGQGKTSFAQTLTEKFNVEGNKCLWFSYEVGLEDFMEKMPEGGRVFHLPRMLKQNSVEWVKQRIIESKAKYNSRIVFIDHLHYLLEMQKMAEAKSLSLLIGMMLRELKRISIEQDVLIFLITHMKKIEGSESPELEDLRDSSFVAQESDVVIMLARESDMFMGERMYKNTTRVSVKKNRRTGKLGTVVMEYKDNKFFEQGLLTQPIAEIRYKKGYKQSDDDEFGSL